MHMIDHLRTVRGIAIVGPTCTGKTSIIKIISNTLNLAFNIKMRTSVINPAIFSPKELYGSIQAFHDDQLDASKDPSASNFAKGGIFQIVLDVFDKERQDLSV